MVLQDSFANLIKIRRQDTIYFLSVNLSEDDNTSPTVKFSLPIDAQLFLRVWIRGVQLNSFSEISQVTSNRLKDAKICSITDFKNVLAWVQAESNEPSRVVVYVVEA